MSLQSEGITSLVHDDLPYLLCESDIKVRFNFILVFIIKDYILEVQKKYL